MHAVDNLKIGDVWMSMLPVFEKIGYDSDDIAVSGQRPIRQCSHQTCVATAEHESHIRFGDVFAKLRGMDAETRIVAIGRAAKNTNRSYLSHC